MENLTAEYSPERKRLLIKKNGRVSRDVSAVNDLQTADSIIQGVGYIRCFEWENVGIIYTCLLKIK
jgi:hypothetical protein